jgi:hypothetical protein
MDPDDIVSWFMFHLIGCEELPKIGIRATCTDTCGKCSIFRNMFRHLELRKKNRSVLDIDGSNIDEEDQDQEQHEFKEVENKEVNPR